MSNIPWIAAVTLCTSLVACNGSSPARPTEDRPEPEPLLAQDFEGVALSAGFAPAETNAAGKPARWAVAAGPGGGRCVRVETANAGQTYNLLLAERTFPADVLCSVRLRIAAGVEDQGGGLVWRARGPADYYIARWNPLEDNLRVYKVVGGVRSQLQSARVRADPAAWHELRASMVGAHIRVAFDGETLLEVDDGTFPDGGRIGLWTKADATTSFDDLRVGTPPPA